MKTARIRWRRKEKAREMTSYYRLLHHHQGSYRGVLVALWLLVLWEGGDEGEGAQHVELAPLCKLGGLARGRHKHLVSIRVIQLCACQILALIMPLVYMSVLVSATPLSLPLA